MKLGIFLPNWIGDVAMATPTLRALRQHFADAELIGILRPYVADVLAGTHWLDRTILYDPRSRQPRQRGWPLVRQLRRARLDTAILLTNSLRTGLLAWASGAGERIGYVRGMRGPLLSRKLYPPRQHRRLVPTPAVDYFLDLAYAAGCPPQSPRLELATTAEDDEQADRVWSQLGLPAGREVIALNSGGAFGAAKLWPTEYFAVLARRIATELDRQVLVLCGPSERSLARQIASEAGHRGVHSLADEQLGIGLTKACIRRSRLLVTTDSGPRHFAAAFDVPAITLFGPTHIEWSENHHPLAVHLQLKLDCAPCQRRICPLGHHACMRNLAPEQVFRAVTEQLATNLDRQVA
ncbi:MAG TPA: lipopolysaccharide heptosyltransferase II [Pirellulales bacterium]